MLTWYKDFLDYFMLMADSGVEQDSEDDVEYVVVDSPDREDEKEEEKDDDSVRLTKEQYEELSQKGNSSDVLNQGLENLAETLKGQGKSAESVPAQQQPGESDQDFRERIGKDLFEDGKTYGALSEAMQREFGPVLNQLAAGTVKLQKKVLRNDPETGEYFKKYEKEIDGFVDGLPMGQRMNPEVYDYAYKQVMQQKQPEVLENELSKREDDIFKKKLEGLGLKFEGGNIVKSDGEVAVYGETGGSRPPSKTKRQVKVSRNEAERLAKIGLDVSDIY